MVLKQKNRFSRILFLAGLMIAGGGFFLSGCALSPNIINPAVAGPQVIVNPDSIRLGVANVMGTDIVFEGSGFQPDDSVLINLAGPANAEVNVANSKVNPDGTFTATITKLTKVTGILRADIAFDTYSEDAKYGQAIVIVQEPIPTGVYTARATGMLSDQKAETKFTISDPSIIDRLKDWIGKKMGKIQDKRYWMK
jgi:hypothetical protein